MELSSALPVRNPERHLRLVGAPEPPTRSRVTASRTPRHLRLLGSPEAAASAPAPTPGFVRALAVQAYEVLTGARTMSQLAPLITLGLARQLANTRALWSERRAVYKDTRTRVPQAAGVRIDRPGPLVAEASVVLCVGRRVHGVAIRIEWAHQQWRATELTIL